MVSLSLATGYDDLVPKWEGYARFCSLSRGLDVIGERWTLVVLQELLHSPRRYSELRSLLPGIGSNVLGDRLRSLERHGLVQRIPGPVGEGVEYALTTRGRQLGPAMAVFRQWGLDELLPHAGEGLPRVYDLSYAVPADLALRESYQWRIGDDLYTLAIDGQALTVDAGPARHPALTLATTREFMGRWAAGDATWQSGRSAGEVTVQGSAAAWDRMLLATGYPGRPPDLAVRLRAQQRQNARAAS
jgi:DNA-binding HxlR family transcriptional regulator